MKRIPMRGAVVAASLLLLAALPAFALSGAIYTSTSTCTHVNENIFESKGDVYLDGGPQGGSHGSGLDDGYYYVMVTEPDGDVLGKSVTPVVHVTDGQFDQCYHLIEILYTASSGFTVHGYDTTTNAGGEYKVWASETPDFTGYTTKTDNFKVDPTADGDPAQVCIRKFYDANLNGAYDAGEVLLDGWRFEVSVDGGDPVVRYTPFCLSNPLGTDYEITEGMPTETNWVHTTPSVVSLENVQEDTTVYFGNVCLGSGGGLTLGFWSNKNGAALFGSDDLALMVSLNLRNGDGSPFDPASYAAFRTWILGATATNMAYMLSAQLAAMELNVLNGKVSGSALLYAPCCGDTGPGDDFITVADLMALANAELGTHGTAYSGDAWRAYQECLKDTLDAANNNRNFVQGTPCPYTFPE